MPMHTNTLVAILSTLSLLGSTDAAGVSRPTVSSRQWVKTASINELTSHAHAPRTLVIRFDDMKPAHAHAALIKILAATAGHITFESKLVPGLFVIETKTTVARSLQLARIETQGVLYAQPAFTLHTNATNDEHWDLLWGLRNNGLTYDAGSDTPSVQGTAGVDIRAEDAWQVQGNGNGVIVAVIDSGVDVNHPDLADAIWTNTDEVAGNGVDDDGNGLIDDRNGWSFLDNNGTWTPQNHGSHCSGTIAAVGNNNLGIVGVAPGAHIMPLQFINEGQGGSLQDAMQAIEYAVANGSRMSNNSWGGGTEDPALSDVIAAAGAQGHLFIFAAGNAGGACEYPANLDLDCIVSVAAIRPDGELANFSARGEGVDLAAPGWGIASCNGDGGYMLSSGTSMAAPHVTGVAALLLAHKPNATNVELKQALLAGARPMASLSGHVETGGMLDAAASLAALTADGGGDDGGGGGGGGGGDATYGIVSHAGETPDHMSVTFTPANGTWEMCREDGVNTLPSGNGGVALNLGDEDTLWIDLQQPFAFGGASFNRLQVHSNGSVTFADATADDWQGTVDVFATAPRIAPLFTDLDPTAGGSIRVQQLLDRTAVSWINVPAYNATDGNTMQLELFTDGRVRMTWTDVPAFGAQAAVIGLGSEGVIASTNDFTQGDLCEDDAAPGEGCHEDVDGDGRVNVQDLIQVLEAWGQCD